MEDHLHPTTIDTASSAFTSNKIEELNIDDIPKISAQDLNIPDNYKEEIATAVKTLKQNGCKKVFLMGDMLTGRLIENFSRIELVLMGIEPSRFYSVCALAYRDMDPETMFYDISDIAHIYKSLISRNGIMEVFGC